MPPNSSLSLAEVCRQHCLLDEAALDELERELITRFADPRELTRELVRRGWLTPWQVNQILLGRADRLILGSYVLLERLGEGGMGAVYKARKAKLGQIVAVRIIRKERLENDLAVQHFRSEIAAAAQLSHPNIAHALGTDEAEGSHLFVSEFVEGRELAHVVSERGPLPVAQACFYVRQAALGLQHVFERGLVHRNIKPSNLLLTRSGNLLKLLDLGLLRLDRTPGDEASCLTNEDKGLGWSDFVAPEQLRNGNTGDIRADLYSLGCTLYFLLTGRVPFPGGTRTQKLLSHQFETPPPLRRFRPDVPEIVVQVLERLMAKQPDQRYQTPSDLIAVLDGIFPPAPLAPAEPRPTASGAESRSMMVAAQPAHRYRWAIVAGVITTLAAGALLLVLSGRLNLLRNQEETADTDGAASLARVNRAVREEQQRRADSQQAFARLSGRVTDGRTTFAELARDVEDFQAKFGGTPAAFHALQLLMKQPSTLDALDSANIAENTRNPWRIAGFNPRDLVGVMTPHRLAGSPNAAVNTASFSADDTLVLLACADDSTHLLDVIANKERCVFRGEKAWFVAGLSSQGGWRMLTLAHDGVLRLFDGRGNLKRELGKADAAAVSPDGRRVLVGRAKGLLTLVDLDTAQEMQQWQSQDTAVNVVAFLPEGQRAVTVGPDGGLRTWGVFEGRLLREVRRDWKGIHRLAAFPEGHGVLIATKSEHAARMIGLETRYQIRWWEQDADISALALAPDGSQVALAFPDGVNRSRLRLYNAAKGDLLREWSLPSLVHDLAFAHDGRHLLTANTDGAAYIFRLGLPRRQPSVKPGSA